jgi:hypothetical protein
MFKAMLGFLLMFVLGGWVMSSLAGGGGVQATYLTAAITAADTDIHVVSTAGFLTSGIIFIDNEEMYFSNTGTDYFTVSSRGYNSTTATVHALAVKVMSEDAGIMNYIFAFDISTMWNNQGIFALPKIVAQFFTRTLPALAKGQSFLYMFDGSMAIVASIWLCFGGAFLVLFVMWVISLIRGN